ncbi:MAG TPA: hypothetical protein VHI52_16275 [Verrucomicrobiae bacterium]|nr:hypothetical protein [Verrucomicrobiae bacterium]
MKFLCSNVRTFFPAAGLCLGLASLVAGCGRNDVQVYRVEKDSSSTPAQTATATMPPGHPDTSGAPPSLKWKSLPAGWEESPPGQMRVAAFRIQGKEGKQADLGVIPLPGLMGHDLDNVNRWRENVGLPAVSEADLAKLAQSIDVGGQPGQLYDQAGENPGSGEKSRILVAVSRRDGVAWFFKMIGDDELVAQQKPAFIDFLKTVSFEAAPQQAGLPPSHPAIGGSDLMSAQANAPQGSDQGKPAWQVPANWQETSGGPFLLAKFVVAGSPQTSVNVSMSAGEGGGLVMNVNRWRGQLGLGPASEEEISKGMTSVDTAGGKAMFVELDGTDAKSGQKAHMVAAIVPQAGRTWFYKLMGDEKVVADQKDAFTKFVQTAKYQQ